MKNNIKSTTATFLKKNGDERKMSFVKLDDLPKEFLSSHLKGSNRKSGLSEGMEIVWDIDSKGFRVFNWNTIVGEAIVGEVNSKKILDSNNAVVV
tara:strand:+ start:322 stop:606 length:285 start_codon:yes stop_codon:yes gene_type:complete